MRYLLGMKKLILGLFLMTAACASNPYNAKYKEEQNAPKFGNSRSFVEAPEDVLLAARAALDELSQQSDPPATGSLKSSSESVETGWVYSTAKNRYVEYTIAKVPKRKPLRIRRKYSYAVTPSLAGSQVLLNVEEEVMKIDLKTGEEKGWSSEETDPEAYDLLTKRLKEKLRSM